jgi:hypothetical protein
VKNALAYHNRAVKLLKIYVLPSNAAVCKSDGERKMKREKKKVVVVEEEEKKKKKRLRER